ncbi:MAG TPA: fibronectin type III domain-containing protein [Pseudobacteroides sp.]|uniref:fibronectin type III domain-containing protein n=1 Tax=Pseudobacteroides sp. TaxID=1968840 RepID=UPI002F930E15
MKTKLKRLLAGLVIVSLLAGQCTSSFSTGEPVETDQKIERALENTPKASSVPSSVTAVPDVTKAVYTAIPTSVVTPTLIPRVNVSTDSSIPPSSEIIKTEEILQTPVTQEVYGSYALSAPLNLSVESKTESTVTLKWESPAEDAGITDYELYEGESVVGSVYAGTTSYKVENLKPYTPYSFVVKSKDKSGNLSQPSNKLDVKLTVEPAHIKSDLRLYEDKVYGDLYIDSGNIDLNGHKITVNGNFVQSNGNFNINFGQLDVTGNFQNSSNVNVRGGQINVGGNFAQYGNVELAGGKVIVGGNYSLPYPSYGRLVMTNEDDYLLVKGSFFTQTYYNHDGYLTAGVLEVKGDFTEKVHYYRYNFKATGKHKVVLSGTGLQTVNFEAAESGFATLELNNNSLQGVKFATPINAVNFIRNACKVSFTNGDVTGWKLDKDETYDGDLYLAGETLDLNGHRLTVNGSLIQSGGTVYINGGQLTVTGDYRMQTASKAGNGVISYSYGNGYLKMVNDIDYVKVEGSFITQSQYSHSGMLTAGTLEVKGDFIQKRQVANDNFKAGKSHKIILSGSNKQNVAFDSSSSQYSCFGTLEIINSSAAGVSFGTKTVIAGEIKTTTTPLTDSRNIYLASTASIVWDTWPYDLSIEENRTLNKDLAISGDFYINGGTFNQNNYKVSIGKSLSISSDVTLSGSVSVGKDLTINSTLNLNGQKVNVGGNVSQSGTLIVGGGQMSAAGNYTVPYPSYGRLQMTNEKDYLLVEGSFFTQTYYSHDGYLTAGILEVKGDFTQKVHYYRYNFKATGSHKVVLSGTGLQTVSFEAAESGFSTLEIKNYSDQGVKFVTPPNVTTLIRNGCKISFTNGDILGWKLEKDETYEGDLYLAGETLDLNGYNLLVKGNIIQSGGTLFINGGQLTIEGDYRMQTAAKATDGTVSYSYGNGYLKMVNEKDYIKVNGSFITQSQYSHNSLLTAGILEIKGDFIQKRQIAYDNFKAGGTHKVVLSGTALQNISFDSPASQYSCFGTLEITNSSQQGVKFVTKTVVAVEAKTTTTPLTDSRNIYLGGAAVISWDTWPYDLCFEENRTLQKDLNISGDLYINGGSFNQNKYKISIAKSLNLSSDVTLSGEVTVGKDLSISSTLNLAGQKVTVGGNVTQSGTLVMGGGQMLVAGNYTLPYPSYGRIQMTNEKDYLLVGGSFFTQAYYNHDSYLTAGVLEVKGDFTERVHYYRYNFRATGKHKVILSGTGLQTVYMEAAESGFNILELNNNSVQGIRFATPLNAVTFIRNDCKVSFTNGDVLGWKLEEDETYEGDLYLAGETLDLNGHKLTVKGNLIQSGGTIYINGGQLEITGDYRMQTAAKAADGTITYGYGNGYLKMVNQSDYVTVGGSFITQSQYSHNGMLAAGTLEVLGDFVQKRQIAYDNFKAGVTHKTILRGAGLQNVSFDSPASGYSCFGILEITNSSEKGVKFLTKTYVTGELKETTALLTDSRNLYLGATAVINWDVWPYDLSMEENRTLNKDLNISGDLFIDAGAFNQNKFKISVGKSLNISASITLTAELTVNKDFSINNNTFNVNGQKVTVGGNVSQTGTVVLGGGQMSVAGNYTLPYPSYGRLQMTNQKDYLLVGGNFFTQSYYNLDGYLTAGVLEVRGDFTQRVHYYRYNFKATGTHKVILSGAGLQTVSFEAAESGFSTLELLNSSEQGVKFATPLRAVTFIRNGCRVSFANGDKMGWKLTKDETIDGDLYLAEDVLDLNGYTLTVKGNLVQSGGTVYINGGKLFVSGDYRIQTAAKAADGTISFSYSNGFLKMVNDSDYIEIGGNFITQSQYSHNGYLKAGVINLKGDFTQKRQIAADNFKAEGTHTLMLSGKNFQTISFENTENGESSLGTLEIANTSLQGLRFATKTVVTGEVKLTKSTLVDSENLYLGSTAAINWESWPYNLSMEGNTTLKKDLNIQGSLNIYNGNFNQNGYKINVEKSISFSANAILSNDVNAGKDMVLNGTIDLKGHKLIAGGSISQSGNLTLSSGEIRTAGSFTQNGTVVVSGGQIVVEKDYSIPYGTYGRFQMTNEADYVLVKRNFFTQTYYGHEGYLTAGVLEVRGDFTQRVQYYGNNFKATGTHKVMLNGSGLQNVYFENPGSSSFNILSINKQMDIGYTFNKTPVWNKLLEEENDKEPPTAVIDLSSSSKTETKVSLTWTPSNDNVGVAGYYVYRNGELISSTAKSNYLDTDLIPDTHYVYKVAAFDIVRNISADSNIIEVRTEPDISAPTSPKNLTAAAKTPNSVLLSWVGSTDNVKVIGYKVIRNGEELKTTTGLSFLDSELPPGTYKYIIKAYDNAGNISEASNELIFDNQAPAAPELTVVDKTTTTISLSWTVPEDNIGVTAYDIYRNNTKIKTIATNSYKDAGLTPDSTYTYYVIAYDAAGNLSVASNEKTVDTVVDTEKPTVPANLSLASRTGHTISLTWTASTDNVSVKGYEIYRDGALISTSATNKFTDKELVPDTTYKYSVAAYDNAGNKSEKSLEVSCTPVMPHIKSVSPSDGTTIGGTGNQLTVSITNSFNYTGAYATFEYSKDGTNWISIGSGTGASWNYNDIWFSINWDYAGITESGSYKVRYTVYDAGRDSDSSIVTLDLDRSAPSIPTNLTAVSKEGSIELKWEASPELDTNIYRVYRSVDAGARWSLAGTVTGRSNVNFKDTGLEIGKTYYYKISAVDKLGLESNTTGVISAIASSETTPPVILGIEPANNTVMGSNCNIVVRAQDNVQISSIKLQYSLNGTDNWNDIRTVNTTGNANFSWTTPTMNGNVYIRAIAVDTSGNESDGTPVRAYVIDRQGPQKVTGLKAIPASNNITLNWDDVPDNDFSYFQVECQNEDGSFKTVGTVSTQRGIQLFGLLNNTTFVYRVCAYDKYGNRGEVSETLSVTTTDDDIKPVITYLGPVSKRYKDKLLLSASIYDNIKVVSAVFQVSRDRAEWTDIVALTASASNAYVSYNYDILKLEEGKIYIRCIAKDGSGNVSDGVPINEYIVDHTPPATPTGVEVATGASYIDLKWDKGTEEDLSYYNIYRSKDGGAYEKIASGYQYLNIRDRNLQSSISYRYKITAVDSSGNESEAYQTQAAKLITDTEKPQILSVSYANNAVLPANPRIRVLAEDNYLLESITMKYRLAGSTEWTLVKTVSGINNYSNVCEFNWDSKGLTEENYEVVFTAKDVNGYESDELKVTYSFNLAAPKAPELTAKAGGWKVELTWSANAEPDMAGYHVLRSTNPDGGFSLIAKTTKTSYEDLDVQAGTKYYYKVEAVDQYLNASKSNTAYGIPTVDDTENPVAVIKAETQATTKSLVKFDSSRSSDNHKIEKVLWSFGDGEESTEAISYHNFSTAGEYTVKLTVYDSAGNKGFSEQKINIMDDANASTVKVQVVDDSTGTGIGGADIVVKLPDGTEKSLDADSSGIAEVLVPLISAQQKNSFTAYAFKNGYQPAKSEISITPGTNANVIVKLHRGEVVDGSLTFKRMTLDEIKAAGIDVRSAANQYVYSFTIHLGYKIICNGNGQIGNTGLTHTTYVINDSVTSKRKYVYVNVIPAPDPSVPPTVSYMEIPGEMSMLKEFFQVNLTVQNLAQGAEFVLEGSKAKLNAPYGLTVVKGEINQNLTPVNIPGGGEGKASWIIRGDEIGEYSLSADFSARLQPFDALIEKRFVAKDKLKVYGLSAMKIYCEAENIGYKDDPYLIRLGIMNKASFSQYNVSFKLKEGTNFTFKEGQNLDINIPELKAGEIKWYEFWLLPSDDLSGPLDLSQTKVIASTDAVEWEFTSIQRSRGSGLSGWYFDNEKLCGSFEESIDGNIDFSWGSGKPKSWMSSSKYSVLWEGNINLKYNEEYMIRVDSKQGVRVFVEDLKVVDTISNNGETSFKISYPGAKIRIEYYQTGSNEGGIKLLWSSKTQAEEVIPSMYMENAGQKNLFMVAVVSKSDGSLLNGAQISLTDKDGNTYKVVSGNCKVINQYEGPETAGFGIFIPERGDYTLKVELQGYNTYEMDISYDGYSDMMTVVLDKETSTTAPYVIAAFDETYNKKDLSLSATRIEVGSSSQYRIHTYVNWRGHRPGNVYIVKGAKSISSSDGIFEAALGKTFDSLAEDVYIVAESADGSRSQMFKVMLQFEEPPQVSEEADTELLPPPSPIKLPFDTYGILDDEITCSLGPLKAWHKKDVEYSSNEIKDQYAIGIELDKDALSNGFGDIKGQIRDDLKTFENGSGALADAYQKAKAWEDLRRELQRVFGKKVFNYSNTLDYSVGAFAYAEVVRLKDDPKKIKQVDVGVLVLGEADFTHEQQFFIGSVPIVAFITLQGSVEYRQLESNLSIENLDGSKPFRITPKGTLKLEGSIEVGGGVGIAKVASVTLSGQFGPKVDIIYTPDTIDVQAAIFAKLNLTLKALIFERKITLKEKEWPLN